MDDVERGVGQRHVLADRLDQRKLDTRLALQSPRCLELRRRRVDADDTRTAACKPGREVGGSAAELDDVEAVPVTEDVQVRLRRAPDAPPDFLFSPLAPRGLVRELR